jgi:hypothetical protein
MDINPPALGALVIEGRLDFADSATRSLTCKTITVW